MIFLLFEEMSITQEKSVWVSVGSASIPLCCSCGGLLLFREVMVLLMSLYKVNLLVEVCDFTCGFHRLIH